MRYNGSSVNIELNFYQASSHQYRVNTTVLYITSLYTFDVIADMIVWYHTNPDIVPAHPLQF